MSSEVQDLYGSRVPTATEMHVISLVAEGKKNREVARATGTSENIVKNMLPKIFDKIGVWNRTELALWYVSRFGSALWAEERGQDIAEYAVMLAVILVLVVGTVKIVGAHANGMFSSVSSNLNIAGQ